jgi:hypothetical protein
MTESQHVKILGASAADGILFDSFDQVDAAAVGIRVLGGFLKNHFENFIGFVFGGKSGTHIKKIGERAFVTLVRRSKSMHGSFVPWVLNSAHKLLPPLNNKSESAQSIKGFNLLSTSGRNRLNFG